MGATEQKFKVGDRVVQDKSRYCCDLVEHWNTYWKRESGPLTDDTFIITQISDGARRYVHYSSRVGASGPQIEEHFLKLAPLKIEAGKFYKTRDGRKAGPVILYGDGETACGNHDSGSATVFTATGLANYEGEHPDDFIAEWFDELAVAESNYKAAQAKPAKFKVGDLVMALVDDCDVTKGKTYEVAEITESGEVRIFDDVGDKFLMFNDEIIIALSPRSIVALIEDGQPKPATKPKIHPDQASATSEAERLALAYPGQEFGVFVLADSKIADIVTTQTAVLRAA